jgi:hypothetical protein
VTASDLIKFGVALAFGLTAVALAYFYDSKGRR